MGWEGRVYITLHSRSHGGPIIFFSARIVDDFKILRQKKLKKESQAGGDSLDHCHLNVLKAVGASSSPPSEACGPVRSLCTWVQRVRTHSLKEMRARVSRLSRGPRQISRGKKQVETRWMN